MSDNNKQQGTSLGKRLALIGVAVLATGRPCHLRYNYEQQQQYTGKRSPFFTTVRYAADKATGKIKAMEADWIVDHGPYSEFGDLLTLRWLRHRKHPRPRQNGLHEPRLGGGVPWLRRSGKRIRLRSAH